MRRLALGLTIVAVWSCTNASPGTTTGTSTAAEVGTYTLESLNAKALPTSVAEGGTQIEVTAGTLMLSAGNSVRISTTFRPSPNVAPQTQEVAGTYRLQGNSLAFSYTNGGANTGILNGATLQMTNEGVVWSYRRR